MTCYNLCFSQKCFIFWQWGPSLLPLPQWMRPEGGEGAAQLFTPLICRAALAFGRQETHRRPHGERQAHHPYLMVFLLVVVLETILTLPPVLELTPRLLLELKLLPPP